MGGLFAVLLASERKRPLREPVEPGTSRLARNLALAALDVAVAYRIERPILDKAARAIERRGLAVVPRLPLPRPARSLAAVLLLDYSLYGWHVASHRAGLLWRFHQVHHADLDLDLTTAYRLHFGEALLAIPFHIVQMAITGVSLRTFEAWRMVSASMRLFHHSNLRMSALQERSLVRWLVTPRMHGIHHSMVRSDAESNYSRGLTLWDRMHGTLRLNLPQEILTIGLPAWRRPGQIGIVESLALPFARDRDPWQAPPSSRPSRSRALIATPEPPPEAGTEARAKA
ncbi:MAG: sterol desaturase family protein [Candidatus Eisenbacteria bacterium]